MIEPVASYRRLFSIPSFRALFGGEVVSLVGHWFSYVGLSVYALERGEGALDVAMVLAGHTLPGVLVAPLAGKLADGRDARAVLLAVNLAAAGLTAALALAAGQGAPMWLVHALIFTRTATEALAQPAVAVATRNVVPTELLSHANTASSTAWSASFAIGTALGGLLATLGPALALGLDALSFVLAAAWFLRLPALPPVATTRAGGALRPALDALSELPALRRATLARAPLAVTGGAAWVMLNLRAEDLAGAAVGIGLLHGMRGIAMGTGPLLAQWRVDRGEDTERLWWRWGLLGFLGPALLGLASGPLAWASAFLWGVGTATNWVFTGAGMLRDAPSGVLGRVTAVENVFTTASTAAGAIALALLVDSGQSLAAASLALVALGLSGWAALWWSTGPGHRHARATSSR